MSRGGYGKYRRGSSHASFQFDNLFKENTNKPSAARSAATVGKWGITSFTSTRTINGYSRENSHTIYGGSGGGGGGGGATASPIKTEELAKTTQPAVPKPKKFFKSRNAVVAEIKDQPPIPPQIPNHQPPTYSTPITNDYTPAKRPRISSTEDSGSNNNNGGSSGRSKRKFFASKTVAVAKTPVAVLAEAAAAAAEAAAAAAAEAASKEDPTKPPIVLRIYRGKSQLLNDSDESESTPTPASTPTNTSSATSPRGTTAQRSPNCRITRSARRSMQQDSAECDPAVGDTAFDFSQIATTSLSTSQNSSITSPTIDHHKQRRAPSSPDYIPAEKYELERKALYDTLLGKNTDSPPAPLLPTQPTEVIQNASKAEDAVVVAIATEKKEDSPVTDNDNVPKIEESTVHHTEDNHKAVTIQGEWATDSDSDTSVIPPAVEPENSSTMKPNENKIAEPAPPSTPIAPDPTETAFSAIESSKTTVTTIIQATETYSNEMSNTDETAVPSVKLVISKKKGSIFKSRSLVSADDGGTRKRRAVYTHKWSSDGLQRNPEDSEKGTTSAGAGAGTGGSGTNDDISSTGGSKSDGSSTGIGGKGGDGDFGFQDEPLTKVVISNDQSGEDSGDPITSIKCTKGDKGYYTVVRNVKKAHQMQEIGEFQEFNDDVEYILDALQDNNPISTRCLSAITLASKCMVPAFRMHVRAHGTVAKFFKALHDATKDQSLGLCTATVMFVLSQDRLNMDLDRDCLELMLNLLESDVSYQQALDVCGLSSAQLEKNKQKVREICTEIQNKGHAIHLNLDNITVGQLAMETLLSLTSKRAGEWFKEELRELGGLEHIMNTICECCRQVSDYVVSWTDTLLDKLRKVDRCLRVLENVTHNNEENQTYLLNYREGIILDTMVNLYKLCDGEIPLYPMTDISDKESTGTIIREALLVTLKVLINLTHHFNKQSKGSALIGSRPAVIETSLHLLLQVPNYIPEQKKFELGVLVLMLLINLIQDNVANKKILVDAKAPSKHESVYSGDESAVEALVAQFYYWMNCAKIAENRTNAILDGEEKDTENANVAPKTNEEFIEETVAKLLQKAGTHMEYTFLASYIVMLTGFLIMESSDYQNIVRQFLKGNNFSDMVELLKKFFNFMNLTSSTEASSVCAIKTTEKVIKYLEECDKPQSEKSSSYSECVDLSYTMAH